MTGALLFGRGCVSKEPTTPTATSVAKAPTAATAAPTAVTAATAAPTAETVGAEEEPVEKDVVAFTAPKREPKVEPAEPPAPRKTEPARSGRGLDPAKINATIQKRLPGIQAEYSSVLKRDRRVGGGKVSVRFTITAAGTVTDATVIEDTVGSPALTEAILARVKSWKFQKSGGDATVIYPFVFVASVR